MEQAEATLLAYVERPKSQPPKQKLHVQLTEELRESMGTYLDLSIGFSKQQST
jgi:hypothetical protein